MAVFYPPFYPYAQPRTFIPPATLWTRIQGTGVAVNAGGPNEPLTFASNVTAGNLLIVNVVGWTFSSSPTLTVTDSQGNTYTQDATLQTNYTVGSFVTSSIFRAIAGSTGANTVTVASSPSSFLSFGIEEVRPPSGVVAVDASSTGTGSSTTASTGNLSLSQVDYIVFGMDVHTNSLTYTAGATFQLEFTANGTLSEGFASQYNWNANAASVTPSLTISSSSSWNAVSVAYKVNAAANHGLFFPANLSTGSGGPFFQSGVNA